MGAARTRMEITPEIIDLGDRVIQLSQVASVQAGTVHPWRSAARYPLIAGVILLAAASARGGVGFDGLSLLGLAMLATALAMIFIGLSRLVIATSDGDRVLIAGRDMAFLRLVLDRIRSAMTGTDPGLHIAIDLTSSTIVAGDTSEPARASLPRLQVPAQNDTSVDAPSRRTDPELPSSVNGAHSAGRDDAFSAPVDVFGGPPLGSFADRRREALGGAPLAMPSAAPPGAESDPRAQILALVALIDDAEIAHKAQLHDLLDPVRDHLTGGRTRKNDARHHWKLFHDYAQQYLGAIDGLPEACESLEQALG